MKDLFFKFSYKLENMFFLRVIHRALTTMIPFIMAGALAMGILEMPVPAVQNLLALPQFAWLNAILSGVYYGSYQYFSPVFVIAIALSYTINRNVSINRIPFFILVASISYATALNINSPNFTMADLGIQGCFQALIVAFFSCRMYDLIQKQPSLYENRGSGGLDIVCSEAIDMILPAFGICVFWAAFNHLLELIWNVYSLHELMTTAIQALLSNIGTGFLSALIYTFVLHLLWLMGFHGSQLLKPVALNNFSAYGPDIIFSTKMFDVFVVMGGCGTTICILIAVLLFTKKKRLRKIAYAASFPALLNINEIIIFGLPIVMNPILAIPFLLVPIEALIISCSAFALGLCPPVINDVGWSTPFLFTGYLSTGSLRGTLLQLFILAAGTATYLPFLRVNEEVYEVHLKKQLKHMISEMQRMEEAGIPIDFLSRTDELGLLAQMLLRDIKLALKEKKVFLLYQPQMDHNGHCIGAEALIRWNHPLFGYIYPPLLIYITKAGNMLSAFETQLFDMACDAIGKISKEYDGEFKISVNITAQSLSQEGLEDYIQAAVNRYQIPAQRLWLEITEQDILSNSENALGKLSRLKEMGHSLLIDDFGMGHTSLIYLQSGHFDVVKLDGSLTKSILTSETNRKIVSSIIDLSRDLNVKVIAEFVETTQEMDRLHLMGCDWYQGYLFSPAVPLEEFMAYLKAHQ